MSKVCVFLADGFEEIEGLTVVDILRRAGIETETVSVMGRKEIVGAHGIKVEADTVFEEAEADKADMLALPGGMPGTLNLKACDGLTELLNPLTGIENILPRSARLRGSWQSLVY